jgi:methionyl-tRNA synthetase
VQICGKDNLRQQSAMWQAMLMSAKLPKSKQIFVNGFIIVDGKKMSKSLGNVILPYEMVEKFGTDATRYLLLVGANFGEDFDITWEKLTERYNADLANGLGNLVSRVIKLFEKSSLKFELPTNESKIISNNALCQLIETMELDQALELIKNIVRDSNQKMQEKKPWELVKNNISEFEKVMSELVNNLFVISEYLKPFLPETSEKIKKALETKKLDAVLFGRIK